MKKRLLMMGWALVVALVAAAQQSVGHGRGRVENALRYAMPEGAMQRRVGSRASAPLPCVGSPKVPVILVQFSDLRFTVEETEVAVKENYQRFFNGTGLEGVPYRVEGGSWGSVRDYYIEQSDSLFQPEFTVIGPVTLSQGYAYYGRNVGVTRDANYSAFCAEACQMAVEQSGVPLSDFDSDGDGIIDFVFFIYAGYGENDSSHDDSNTIWPKESPIRQVVEQDGHTYTFVSNGCTCELYDGAQDGIGLVCHELNHGLGLPDLYDTNYVSFGLDYWDVMDAGNYQLDGKQPCGFSAYERDFMGWRALEEVETGAKVTLTLLPIEVGGKGYIIRNDGQPSGNEYFILENRQNIGFDTALGCPTETVYRQYGAAHGLLITHVDYLASAWASNAVNTSASHQRMTLVPADGQLVTPDASPSLYYTSFRGDAYPGNQHVTEMSDYTVFTGTFTQTVSNIVEHEDGTVTVDINGGGAAALQDTYADDAEPVAVYSLSGVRQKGLQRGVNIVRYRNGVVRKEFVTTEKK